MKYLLTIIILYTTMADKTIFDFDKQTGPDKWQIEDDVVMGGRSSGHFSVNDEGHGVFEGHVSLENNGGFSSLRYKTDKIDVSDSKHIVVRLKGDGKKYQLRIKHELDDKPYYVSTFDTSGEWEEIKVRMAEMYPSFHGEKMDIPDFNHDSVEEVTFLIGNKKEQDFKLLIDKITLE
ncbi:MAG: CIA30 family protein [Cyclobacteriaceae bacterium]